MKEIIDKALDTYITLLILHINTKSSDYTFHTASEDLYKKTFDIFHSIAERAIDLWMEINPMKDYITIANTKLVSLKDEIEKSIKEDQSLTIWTNTLLTDIVSDLESLIWTSKSLMKDADNEAILDK